MRSIYIFIVLIICGLSFTSCENFDYRKNSDAYFHVRINNAELPVWVRGNTESRKFILYINGGPGLTSIDAAKDDLFGWSESLEKNYAVVYYDQRGCGNSQGNILERSLTVSQFTADLNAIIIVLDSLYKGSSIFLMGHNFGSFIGANFLMDSVRQSKVSGWISVNGAYNFDIDLQWEYRHKFLINIAEEEISKGQKTAYWTEALDWANTNPKINTPELQEKWREYIGNPGDGILPPEEDGINSYQYLSIGLQSYNISLPAYLQKNLELVNKKLLEDTKGKNLISDVSAITIPSLFIWGRYDDLIPPEQGIDAYNNLGTTIPAKTFILIDECGHEPHLSHPDRFQNSIFDFINKH